MKKKNNYHLSEADNPPKSNAADNGEEVALIIFKLIRLKQSDSILFQKGNLPFHHTSTCIACCTFMQRRSRIALVNNKV